MGILISILNRRLGNKKQKQLANKLIDLLDEEQSTNEQQQEQNGQQQEGQQQQDNQQPEGQQTNTVNP